MSLTTPMNPSGNLLPAEPGKRSRIENADDTAATVEAMVWANRERERKWAQWLGMFQGNPPYSPTALRNAARMWQNNFNPRTGTGFLSAGCTPYYDLFEGGPVPAVVRLKDKDKTLPGEVMRDRSQVVTEEFAELLNTEGWLSDAFYRLCYGFVGFGRSYWFWPATFGWKPKVKLWYEVLHPENAETDPTTWELVVVRVNLSLVELYAFIRNEAAAREAGWNPKAVKEAIKRAMPLKKESAEDWILYQRELHDHALTTSSRLGVVQLAYVYAREWDGKWTLGILPRYGSSRAEGPVEYLFLKQGVADSLDDLLVPFYYDTADGSVNGVEGLASMIYPAIRNMDRLTCTIADGGHLRALPILTPSSASAQAKGGITILGGCAVVPVGFNIQNGQVMSDMDGPISAHRHLSDSVQQNTGLYMPKAERPVGNPDTATASAQRAQQQTKLTVSGVNRFYGYLDKAFNTVYRRVLRSVDDPQENTEKRSAKEFVANCKARGVTVGMLQETYPVKAYRVVGAGGAGAKQAALGALFPLVGTMPQRGKAAYIDQLVSATVGPAQVREFFPRDVDEPGEGEWEATVEGNLANGGSAPMFTNNQDHASHLKIHVRDLAGGIQAAGQGADPNGVLAFSQIMLPHAGLHLQSLSLDKTAGEKVKAFEEALKQIAANVPAISQMVQQQQEAQASMQQAQQVQAGMDPGIQLEAAQVQAKMQLKAQQQQANLALKARKQMVDEQLSAARVAQEMRQKAQKHQLDVAIATSEAQQNAAKEEASQD